ncbi:hypothetical protein [uncultured phage MedDCM-OCT-S06-C1041]|nr:hypothetical protein [uncultured phage MedDCM-OCT-S06-C1041]
MSMTAHTDQTEFNGQVLKNITSWGSNPDTQSDFQDYKVIKWSWVGTLSSYFKKEQFGRWNI